MNPFLKFALFGVIGPLLIGLLYFSVMTRVTTHASRSILAGTQRQSAAVAERARARHEESSRQATESQRMQLETKAAQLRTESAAALLEQKEAARKEAAWQAFFKPKKVCDNPPDSDTQVECGNAHMRSKREFEDRWVRGAIR